MEPEDDAFGLALREYHDGGDAYEIVERDDGYIDANPVEGYFADYDDWGAAEREAIEYVDGRVLDVGCGAGRHALYLQDEGFDVLGLDLSPGAIAVAEARGVTRTLRMPVTGLTDYDGDPFDTVCMFGNNFGLVGTREHAPTVLGAIDSVTTDDATVLAGSMDPYQTDEPAHLAYQDRNDDRGRLPGALRLRVRYKAAATEWYDYLLAAEDEMEAIANDVGWRVDGVVDGGQGPRYVGVLAPG